MPDTPDVIAMFDEIKADAERALASLAEGSAKNGAGALQSIRGKADDGARWARVTLEGADPYEQPEVRS